MARINVAIKKEADRAKVKYPDVDVDEYMTFIGLMHAARCETQRGRALWEEKTTGYTRSANFDDFMPRHRFELLKKTAPFAFADVTTLEWKSFDASRYSQEVTECDRLAGHSDDPNKVVPGIGTRAMDLPAAIQACRTDLAQDPQNPRLQYQLARALTYNGRVTEALPIIEQALSAGYPQAIFVTGYLYLEGA